MLSVFSAANGQFNPYYAAENITVGGGAVALPAALYLDASSRLTTQPNGRQVARIVDSGGVQFEGASVVAVGAIYLSPKGELVCNQPNGRPVAEVRDVGGVLDIQPIERG